MECAIPCTSLYYAFIGIHTCLETATNVMRCGSVLAQLSYTKQSLTVTVTGAASRTANNIRMQRLGPHPGLQVLCATVQPHRLQVYAVQLVMAKKRLPGTGFHDASPISRPRPPCCCTSFILTPR